jgi:hypothetical protein
MPFVCPAGWIVWLDCGGSFGWTAGDRLVGLRGIVWLDCGGSFGWTAGDRLTRCRQARVPRYTLNAGAVLFGATARWTEPPVTPNALERTAARAWRNRLTRCRQARVPRYTLNAGGVLFGATARWTEPPVTPNALERTTARP